jgi:uncharacterized membrane protein
VRTSEIVLVLTVFGASLVEMVEALTLVLASGTTRGWKSALEGTAAALGILGFLVVVFGVPLVKYVPLHTLQVIVGALLLILGMSWMRKAWLRSSGLKAKHDEDKIFEETVEELRAQPAVVSGRDPVGFAIAFKGVLLEGAEVVIIVISLGASQRMLVPASLAALAAVVLVSILGLIVARQLSSVPENLIKSVVGVMVTSFGVFWVAEGAGLHWPGKDFALLVLIAFFGACTFVAPMFLKEPEVVAS